MFWFYATARKIEIKKSDTLVSDSVNVYPCQFQFSSDWEELTKTAVFRAGSQAIEVILDDNMQCNIPWEVLLKDKLDLYVGCYGTKGEDIILNTTWTNLGKIYEGTKNKAVPGEEPTPDIITQISSQIGDLSSLETNEKSSLVGAINEVHRNIGSGTGSDGSLPAGVASFNGRSGVVLPKEGDYTAEMVGATPAETFENFKKENQNNFSDLEYNISTLNNDKIDKTGGTISGSIMFSEEYSVTDENSDKDILRGTIISSQGIEKSSDGPLNIHAEYGEISFSENTKLSGVLGDEHDLTSVPNMEQLNQKISDVQDDIPTNISELVNDAKFVNESYVQDAISNISTEDITYGEGLTKEENTINVKNPVHGIYTIEEFENLTEKDKINGTYFIDDGLSSDNYSNDNYGTYSLNEIKIGTWIDGKPIYRKVFQDITILNQQFTPIDIVELNVDMPIRAYGIVSQQNYVFTNTPMTTTGNWLYVSKDLTTLQFSTTNKTEYGQKLIAILEYTKTTD